MADPNLFIHYSPRSNMNEKKHSIISAFIDTLVGKRYANIKNKELEISQPSFEVVAFNYVNIFSHLNEEEQKLLYKMVVKDSPLFTLNLFLRYTELPPKEERSKAREEIEQYFIKRMEGSLTGYNLMCIEVCGKGIKLSKEMPDSAFYLLILHEAHAYPSPIAFNEYISKLDLSSFANWEARLHGVKGLGHYYIYAKEPNEKYERLAHILEDDGDDW